MADEIKLPEQMDCVFCGNPVESYVTTIIEYFMTKKIGSKHFHAICYCKYLESGGKIHESMRYRRL